MSRHARISEASMKQVSPLKAIRSFCVACQGESPIAVTECTDLHCPFHPYRHGTPPKGKRHQPMKAVKLYCLDNCQAGAGREEVAICQGDTALLGPCLVFPFRLGVNPNISEATREKARQRELRKMEQGTNTLPIFAAHALFDAPESTITNREGL